MDTFYKIHVKTRGQLYIIPGGKTPANFYKILAKKINDWKDCKFLLSDERLSNNLELLNINMVKKTFFNEIKNDNIPQLINLDLNKKSILQKQLESTKPKIAILGLGNDGHTASLFPGNPNLFNNSQELAIRTKNNNENFYRASLSFKYLMQSDQIFFLINGENKATALKECLFGKYNPIKYPAQFLIKNFQNQIHFFADYEATKYLNYNKYD